MGLDPIQSPRNSHSLSLGGVVGNNDEDFQVSATQQNSQVPSVSSGIVSPPPVDLNVTRVEEDPTPVERTVQEIEQLLNQAQTLSNLPNVSLAAIAAGKNKELLKIMENQEKREKVEGIYKAALGAVQFGPDMIHDALIEPYESAKDVVDGLIQIPPAVKENIANMMDPVNLTRTVLQGVELTGDFAALMVQNTQYQQSVKLYKKKSEELKKDPSNIELKKIVSRLGKFIKTQKNELKDRIVNVSYAAALVSTKVANLVLDSVKSVSSIAKGATGWICCVLDAIWAAITLLRTQKDKSTLEAWEKEIIKNPRALNDVHQLLNVRLERMILRKISGMSFEQVEIALKDKGVSLGSHKITNIEKFKGLLSDKDFCQLVGKALLTSEDEKIETLKEMTKKGIDALAQVKVKNEKKFFKFKLLRSKLELALASASAALTIVLEVLAIAGIITLAASSMALPGLGFFVMGVAIMGVGLYFFYRHKPNLFKCYIRGVNLRLAFNIIPAKIQGWRLERKKKQVQKNETRLKAINVRHEQLQSLLDQNKNLQDPLIPKDMKKTLEKLHRETSQKIDHFERLGESKQIEEMMKQLQEQAKKQEEQMAKSRAQEEELSKTVESWLGKEGRVTKLQNRLKEAGSKDFALANRLLTTADHQKMDIPSILVENILDSKFDFEFDKETVMILKQKMGINLKKLSQENKLEKSVLLDHLKEFFKMDDSELVNFMRAQLHQ